MSVLDSDGHPNCWGFKWVDRDGKNQPGWDPTDANCRDRCTHYSSCGAEVRARREGRTTLPVLHQLPSQMSVPSGSSRVIVPQAPSPLARVTAPVQPMVQYPAQQAPVQSVQAPPGTQMMYVAQPAQMMPVNYAMPAFLSAPEPDRGNFWGALSRELFRSVCKAGGHSVAHFFDSVPLGKKDP